MLGIRGGAEAAVHGVRRFLDSITGDSGIVKLDFANAFNSVSRSSVVSAVSTHLPQLELPFQSERKTCGKRHRDWWL